MNSSLQSNLSRKRLLNEINSLVTNPIKDFMVKSYDVVERKLVGVINDIQFTFEFELTYPFTAPLIQDQHGKKISINSVPVFAVSEIIGELKCCLVEQKLNENINKKFEELEVLNAPDDLPTLDELLQLPEDGEKGKEAVLDELDIEIAERRSKHEREMANIDDSINQQKRRLKEWQDRMKENALLRNRLGIEITKPNIIKMFSANKEYLEEIKKGHIESTSFISFVFQNDYRPLHGEPAAVDVG